MVSAALQKQAVRDFGPMWGITATVDAFDSLESVPVGYWPVILKDNIRQPGAAGYHKFNHHPLSLVQVDDSWPLTASHETLEMLADPQGSRTVAGPAPENAPAGTGHVLYLLEVCDPCEDAQLAYKIDNVTVSDFLTPHFYDAQQVEGVQYSFTGAIKKPRAVLDGGYISYEDQTTEDWYQVFVENGKAQLEKLGKMNQAGKSLREMIDDWVRKNRKPKAAAAAAVRRTSEPKSDKYVPIESARQRARAIRDFVETL